MVVTDSIVGSMILDEHCVPLPGFLAAGRLKLPTPSLVVKTEWDGWSDFPFKLTLIVPSGAMMKCALDRFDARGLIERLKVSRARDIG